MEDDEDYPDPELLSRGNGINLNGRNVGATMIAPRDVDAATQTGSGINIYVNSNVQGTCSSALFGSKVKLRDPGVHVLIGDVKMTGGNDNDDRTRQKEMMLIKVGFCLVCLFNIFLGLILMFSAWFRKKTGSI